MTAAQCHMDRIDSPIGSILLAWDADGAVRALDFEDHAARLALLWRRHWGPSAALPDLRLGGAPAEIVRRLNAYFGGDLTALDTVPTRTAGTAFQEAAWAALRAIPAGRTESYAQQAARMGAPKAVRAVGAANGANPVGIVTPCHRVIGANGALTGYGGGMNRKAWLLAHEGAAFQADLGLAASKCSQSRITA